MGTGELAHRSDAYANGSKVLLGRWAYDHKKDKDGIMFAKARYTVMGCFQTEGVDYGETFAPVMNLKSFRIQLSIVNLSEDCEIEQWDVSSAYLYAYLDEKVFCDQPHGHEDPAHPKMCWRLLKSLYGLKNAGRNWNLLLNDILSKAGMKPIPCDPGSFVVVEGKGWLFICIHVDDIFPAYNKEGKHIRDRVAKILSAHVKIEFLGELDWALKMRVYRDKKAGIMKLSQENFVWEFLTRFNLLNIKGSESPTDPKTSLPPASEVTDEEVDSMKDYPVREIIGCFLWLAQISRPDIAVATHCAARSQHRPSKILWRWIIRIARYLKSTAHWGIVWTRPLDFAKTRLLEQWVDASFAPNPETNRGKSIIGYVVKFLGMTTHWKTMMSKRVCDSSSEAEINGLNEVRKENRWQLDLQNYLGLFKPDGPTLTWEDNTAAIQLTKPATCHKRSKHFGIEWYATKEAIELGEMEVQFVPTDYQDADLLTKPTNGQTFLSPRDEIMGPLILQKYFGTMLPPQPK